LKKKIFTILEQIKANAVAIMSIIIAVYSISYNTWRTQTLEENSSKRVAAFEIMMKLGHLREVLFYNHYEKDTIQKGNPKTGWVYVLAIKDMSDILGGDISNTADSLVQIWSDNWEQLENKEENLDNILDVVEEVRKDTLNMVKLLR
jgi:hypothetical protein